MKHFDGIRFDHFEIANYQKSKTIHYDAFGK